MRSSVWSLYDYICYTSILCVGYVLVVVILIGILGDYVPGVEETREKSEHAEENVDERVGGAEAAFYPDCGG